MAATFDERYKKLNDRQKEAVDTIEGPVMVIAGPGSGKTELLSLRVGNILRSGNAKASNILCLTFTETAAQNMRERLESLIGPDAYRVAIYTFHSFATDIIGRYPEYFYEAVSVRPASDLAQSEILESIFEALPHGHILGGKHPELGYSYLKEAQSKIKDIKKGGLSPERLRELLKENEESLQTLNTILQKHLPERISKGSVEAFEQMKTELEKTKTSLGDSYAREIGIALENCEREGKTTPLSEWKSKWTSKDDGDIRVFKDTLSLHKLYALADIYEEYQKALHTSGLFDYEDMILQVVEALYKNVTLRTELEERFQYIMIDEFQDTNTAQLALVKAISSHPVHEGRPNVCVVGDDDQAVYKFQGAEISNIHSFRELYKDVQMIILIDNYRSTQAILDFARSVVTQGVNRLENRDKEIRKDLVAKNKGLVPGAILVSSFSTEEEEYAYIAHKVKKILSSGVEPREVALIAREHKQLLRLLPYLDTVGVPYSYMRKENVFDEPHVKELITISRFLATVGGGELERDDLLPEILSFSFWGLDRIAIWRIAEHAKREHISWLEAMKVSEDGGIRELAMFLIELGVLAQTTPLEIIIDMLIGSKEFPALGESQDDDEYERGSPVTLSTSFTSPYKAYYFGTNAFKDNASDYIHFLSSLRVFIHALRDYKDGEQLRVHDVGGFVDTHLSYNIPLINETPFAHNENSISLLTSHKAKGLEFEYVFVVSVNDDIWAGGGRRNLLSFPKNLALSTALDDEDDFIRLFYVALTRAKHTLFITHHGSPLRFLSHPLVPSVPSDDERPSSSELVTEGLKVYHIPPFANDEKALLQKVIEGYALPPTHLNNFLNLIDGGPMLFIEQNLLRFPQAKNASSVYGSAIHKALEDAHVLMRRDGKLPSLDTLVGIFKKELSRGRLLPYEEKKNRERGEKVLARYYELKKNEIKGEHLVELNFAKQGVEIEGALLTGKIDKIIDEDGGWTVVDLKTGKGAQAWDEKGKEYTALKLHNYRQQLLMYKLLVEHSRDYSKQHVKRAVLEFVEEEAEGKIREMDIVFGMGEDEGLVRLKDLAVAVYRKITTLDFPDTSSYEKTLDGIIEFEDDLISGKI